jgi:hypothetical protein
VCCVTPNRQLKDTLILFSPLAISGGSCAAFFWWFYQVLECSVVFQNQQGAGLKQDCKHAGFYGFSAGAEIRLAESGDGIV